MWSGPTVAGNLQIYETLPFLQNGGVIRVSTARDEPTPCAAPKGVAYNFCPISKDEKNDCNIGEVIDSKPSDNTIMPISMEVTTGLRAGV